MKKIASFLACVSFLLVAATQFVFGADPSQFCVNNIWRSGQYSFNQESFVSLIASVQKDVLSKSQTQVRFTWNADLSDLDADGVQKMQLQATHVSLRFEGNGAESSFYDSSNSAMNKPFVNEVFQHFMQAKITVVFKNGVVQDVSVSDDPWKGMSEPSNDAEKAFFEHFKTLPTKDNLSQIFDPFSWVSTPKNVGLQEAWKNDVHVQLPVVGDKTFEWNCKLNSVKKNGAMSLAEVLGSTSVDVALEEQKTTANVKADVKANFNSQSGSPWGLEAKTTISAVQKGAKAGDAETKIASFQRTSLRVARR